jgi:hypothetical protein
MTGFHGLKFLSCSEVRVYLRVLSDLSMDEISLQIFESKLFLRGNRAKSFFIQFSSNNITNLITLLYFEENRLLKIPIQNGKMKVIFNKFHHRTNGTFV